MSQILVSVSVFIFNPFFNHFYCPTCPTVPTPSFVFSLCLPMSPYLISTTPTILMFFPMTQTPTLFSLLSPHNLITRYQEQDLLVVDLYNHQISPMSHNPWIVQHCTAHGSWRMEIVVQCCTTHASWRAKLLYNTVQPMCHGAWKMWYSVEQPMGCGGQKLLYNIVQSVGHGDHELLYNPWVMGICPVVQQHMAHGSWAFVMLHGS